MFSGGNHTSIPGNHEHMTLHGKGNFTDVIKVKDLTIDYPGISKCLNLFP